MASSIKAYGTLSNAHGELYYEQEGSSSGPAILFIHGLGGTTNTYQSLVSSLQDYNLVRFDFSGHGRSSLPKTISIDSYVEDAEAVIKHFSLKDVTVVGHSLGCLIALQLCAKNPLLIRRLILYGPIKPPPEAGRTGARGRAETVRKGGTAAVADTVVGNAFSAKSLKDRPEIVGFGRELLCRQDKEGYALACEALAESQDPDWANIKAPTVIVSGSEDKVSSPSVCQAFKGLLRNANVKIVTFEGVGHWHTLEDAQGSIKVLKDAMQS